MTAKDGRIEHCGAQALEVLRYIAAGQDPFSGCRANGDFRRCLLTLAELRRACLIDHAQQLTERGRAALAPFIA